MGRSLPPETGLNTPAVRPTGPGCPQSGSQHAELWLLSLVVSLMGLLRAEPVLAWVML